MQWNSGAVKNVCYIGTYCASGEIFFHSSSAMCAARRPFFFFFPQAHQIDLHYPRSFAIEDLCKFRDKPLIFTRTFSLSASSFQLSSLVPSPSYLQSILYLPSRASTVSQNENHLRIRKHSPRPHDSHKCPRARQLLLRRLRRSLRHLRCHRRQPLLLVERRTRRRSHYLWWISNRLYLPHRWRRPVRWGIRQRSLRGRQHQI